jgi:predicted NAD-dependent protein-ADP-ribosyltransferase YbiA (DUF1768 family)
MKMRRSNKMTEQNILSNGVAYFFSGKKEYRSLSNFWEKDIVMVDGNIERAYESGEHCFHGEKYIRLGELCEDERRKKLLLEYGKTFTKPSSYKTGAVAKKMGGKKGLLLNCLELELWKQISIDIQRNICKWKFENHEEVRKDLLKSGNKILIHPAMRCSQEKLETTRIWEGRGKVIDGKIVVFGKNLLGNIWMELRLK